MKTKNIVLGIVALIIAIEGALATQGSPRPAYVSVLFFGSDHYTCVNTGILCSDYGPLACKVEVSTMLGTVTVAGKRDAGCVTTLGENSNLPVGVYIPLMGIILSAQ